MKEHTKDVLKTVAATGIGAAAGAGTYGLIGVVEITAGGTSVGITLGSFIAIGASVGFASYGIYWLGKKNFFLSIPKKKAFVMNGTVKFFNQRKNFGFIAPEDKSKDLFFNKKDIVSGILNKGDKVEFALAEGAKGKKAVNVKKIN